MDNQTFTFLNQSVRFVGPIDWNYPSHGKLWTYHLNYFDYLNQPNVVPDDGLALIRDFMAQTNVVRDGLDSYPTSLRIINWVQFLNRHRIQDEAINAHLYAQATLLRQQPEYHLMGNHLLENGFALLIASLYFRQISWYRYASKLLRNELSSQILPDGSHNERSPTYHQLLLNQLLTVWAMVHNNTWQRDESLSDFLVDKANQMLSWLDSITFRNGDVPMVNDATFGMAPTTAQIRRKAAQLNLPNTDPVTKQNNVASEINTDRIDSGYRLVRRPSYEVFIDVGPVGPEHQPGHAHADTFSFILYVHDQPVLVDTGLSTYQIGSTRDWERSTMAHNTVSINAMNSSEVWAGFRVGRRAQVNVLLDTPTFLVAYHTGYQSSGILHERSWTIGDNRIRIVDRLLTKNSEVAYGQSGTAHFHAHPSVSIQTEGNVVRIGSVKISFNHVTKSNFRVIGYDMAQSFNQRQSAQCLEVAFKGQLETVLVIPE
ncbi:alginate lyase family protein [Spirosoma profusum]|uniref:alginate lyase family protein n=1 Tax=Spirosoma profusum TaxID=2771354 RepID=UPI00293BBC61|nr:alginate lyase family protein [Spirosoma profusum]